MLRIYTWCVMLMEVTSPIFTRTLALSYVYVCVCVSGRRDINPDNRRTTTGAVISIFESARGRIVHVMSYGNYPHARGAAAI